MKVRQLASQIVQPKPADHLRAPPSRTNSAQQSTFAEELRNAEKLQSLPPVTISRHAEQRLEERGIQMDAARMQRIAEAVSTLNDKGATNALLLGSQDAFVVNIPSRTMVTAVNNSDMTQRAFTNIDSAFVMNESE